MKLHLFMFSWDKYSAAVSAAVRGINNHVVNINNNNISAVIIAHLWSWSSYFWKLNRKWRCSACADWEQSSCSPCAGVTAAQLRGLGGRTWLLSVSPRRGTGPPPHRRRQNPPSCVRWHPSTWARSCKLTPRSKKTFISSCRINQERPAALLTLMPPCDYTGTTSPLGSDWRWGSECSAGE